MEHVNVQINQVVVTYRSAEEVIRPPAPTDVSVCKGIMSCLSFLFLGVPRHYAKRPFSCWCLVQGMFTCARARTWIPVEWRLTCGLDTFGSASSGRFLVS
jgi:hypothetical protein